MIRATVVRKGRELPAEATDFGANIYPVYMEDPPRDPQGNIPADWKALDHLYCPECNEAVLSKSHVDGNSTVFRCPKCFFIWRQAHGPGGVILETT